MFIVSISTCALSGAFIFYALYMVFPVKFIFESEDEYNDFHSALHDSILYWKKVRQDAEGKICLQCDGTQTHYSVQYAIDQMAECARLLALVEDSPHPEWDEDSKSYVIVPGPAEYYSCIVEKALRAAAGTASQADD